MSSTIPSLRYFRLPPAQPFRLALVDPIDRCLGAWKLVDQLRVFSHFFSLLFPLPSSAFSTIRAKRKVTAEELDARAESNGYRRGAQPRESVNGNAGRPEERMN
jgi:hypothetical protein